MQWTDQLTKINEILASLYPTIPASRRIVDISGIPIESINFDNASLVIWYNILKAAVKRGKLENLIRAVLNEYPERSDLNELLAFNNINKIQRYYDVENLLITLSKTNEAINAWESSKSKAETKQVLSSPVKIENRNLINLINLVPDKTIDILTKRINTCFVNYNIVLESDDYLEPEIDKATENVIKCVCRELKRLKKVNGSIPKELKAHWKDYNCDII